MHITTDVTSAHNDEALVHVCSKASISRVFTVTHCCYSTVTLPLLDRYITVCTGVQRAAAEPERKI
jgi:hypothetical protein